MSQARVRLAVIWITVALTVAAGGAMAWLAVAFREFFDEALPGKPLPMATAFFLASPAVYAYPLLFAAGAAYLGRKPPTETQTLVFCGTCLLLTLPVLIAFSVSLYFPFMCLLQLVPSGV